MDDEAVLSREVRGQGIHIILNTPMGWVENADKKKVSDNCHFEEAHISQPKLERYPESVMVLEGPRVGSQNDQSVE